MGHVVWHVFNFHTQIDAVGLRALIQDLLAVAPRPMMWKAHVVADAKTETLRFVMFFRDQAPRSSLMTKDDWEELTEMVTEARRKAGF